MHPVLLHPAVAHLVHPRALHTVQHIAAPAYSVPPPITADLIFYLVAAMIILMALVVVMIRNVIHAALALGTCFIGVAGVYVLLHAQFLAVAQVLVYVGDVTVLILFAIMLTRGVRPNMERWGVPLGAGVGVGLLVAVMFISYLGSEAGRFSPMTQPSALQSLKGGSYAIVSLFSQQMLTDYLLPFEVASGILLMALVGAIVLAREETPDDAR